MNGDSYFIDTNFNYTSNPTGNCTTTNSGATLNLETGVHTLPNINSSHSAPTTSLAFSNDLYSHFTPSIEYIHTNSGDASIASSDSSKISFLNSGHDLSLSTILISQGQNNNNYNNNNFTHQSNLLEDNNNNNSKEIKRGRGRGRTSNSIVRKRQASPNDNNSNGVLSTSSGQSKGKHGKALARHPFIPSYMDPKSGPHLCVVCQHNASGFHYRVMACEGCKGFFRRTVQNNLKYTCKFNNSCEILPHNRAQCQECRWTKCLKAGMAKDLVLSEDARQAKKELIASNRAKRQANSSHKSNNNGHNSNDSMSSIGGLCSLAESSTNNGNSINDGSNHNGQYKLGHLDRSTNDINGNNGTYHKKLLTTEDELLIEQIVKAFDDNNIVHSNNHNSTNNGHINNNIMSTQDYRIILKNVVDFHITSLIIKSDVIDQSSIDCCKDKYSRYFQPLTDIIQPMVSSLVLFANHLPDFMSLSSYDRQLLLQHAAFDLICLRHLQRTNHTSIINHSSNASSTIRLMDPILAFCRRVAPLEMDRTEIALIAALALVTSDRLGLQNPTKVDVIQDRLLTLMDGYLRDNNRHNCPPSHHRQSELYATVLPELRTATNWYTQIINTNLYPVLLALPPPLSPSSPSSTSSVHLQQNMTLLHSLLSVYLYVSSPVPVTPVQQSYYNNHNIITTTTTASPSQQQQPQHFYPQIQIPLDSSLYNQPVCSSYNLINTTYNNNNNNNNSTSSIMNTDPIFDITDDLGI